MPTRRIGTWSHFPALTTAVSFALGIAFCVLDLFGTTLQNTYMIQSSRVLHHRESAQNLPPRPRPAQWPGDTGLLHQHLTWPTFSCCQPSERKIKDENSTSTKAARSRDPHLHTNCQKGGAQTTTTSATPALTAFWTRPSISEQSKWVLLDFDNVTTNEPRNHIPQGGAPITALVKRGRSICRSFTQVKRAGCRLRVLIEQAKTTSSKSHTST